MNKYDHPNNQNCPVNPVCSYTQNFSEYIGKSLFTSLGYKIGKVIGVKMILNQECFELEGNPPNGKYWQISRLRSSALDKIEIR